jgi:tRNA pseudouridine13 synthase
MSCYATGTPGIGGKLRAAPEDFVVEEIPLPPVPAQGAGKYTIATLRATNWETNKLVRELGRRLGISRRGIFFTGTKDKRAVKTQQMAILASEEEVRALRIEGVDVLGTYRSDRAPKLGELLGNRFRIVVRGLAVPRDEAERRCAAIEAELASAGGMPNYFGLQRFGSLRPITQVVGERLVRGDLEGAVMVYVAAPQAGEAAEAFDARRRVGEERDFRKALTFFPRHLTFERVLLQHLAESPDDWTGAIRKLPLNLATMFIYAYQSLLFNRMLSRRLAEAGSLRQLWEGDILLPFDSDGVPDHDTLIPVRAQNLAKCQRQVDKGRASATALVVGLEAPFAAGRMEAIEREVVEAEGLPRSAYAMPAMPELASFGQRRALALGALDWARRVEGDAMRFEFRLPKGSYATCVLREFMKTDARRY